MGIGKYFNKAVSGLGAIGSAGKGAGKTITKGYNKARSLNMPLGPYAALSTVAFGKALGIDGATALTGVDQYKLGTKGAPAQDVGDMPRLNSDGMGNTQAVYNGRGNDLGASGDMVFGLHNLKRKR